jgi:hypothetical protein
MHVEENGRPLIGRCYVASGIDQMFIETIVDRIAKASSSFAGTRFETFRPEITCIIELVFHIHSLSTMSTPGMKLFGLSFNGRSRRASGASAIIACCVLLRALLKRFQLTSLVQQWRILPEESIFKRVWKVLQLIEVVSGFISLGNLFQFFGSGLFPTLMYRASGLTVTSILSPYPVVSNGASSLELHYRYRQLLWVVISGIYPSESLQYQSLLATLHDFVAFISHDILKTFGPLLPGDRSPRAVSNGGDITDRSLRFCCACKKAPAENPSISDCGHVYCYVCVYVAVTNAGVRFDNLNDRNIANSSDLPSSDHRHSFHCHMCQRTVKSVRRL